VGLGVFGQAGFGFKFVKFFSSRFWARLEHFLAMTDGYIVSYCWCIRVDYIFWQNNHFDLFSHIYFVTPPIRPVTHILTHSVKETSGNKSCFKK